MGTLLSQVVNLVWLTVKSIECIPEIIITCMYKMTQSPIDRSSLSPQRSKASPFINWTCHTTQLCFIPTWPPRDDSRRAKQLKATIQNLSAIQIQSAPHNGRAYLPEYCMAPSAGPHTQTIKARHKNMGSGPTRTPDPAVQGLSLESPGAGY